MKFAAAADPPSSGSQSSVMSGLDTLLAGSFASRTV
jgi:hypothetical protein